MNEFQVIHTIHSAKLQCMLMKRQRYFCACALEQTVKLLHGTYFADNRSFSKFIMCPVMCYILPDILGKVRMSS